MALEVETGSGSATAESYASVADADAYLAARGFSLWATMSETEKEAALRRATDYMVSFYRARWAGYRVSSTQALDWPRYDVPMKDYAYSLYASDEVPAAVKNACIVLAFKAASPIEVTYAVGSRQWTLYRSVENMLSSLMANSGASVRLVRA